MSKVKPVNQVDEKIKWLYRLEKDGKVVKEEKMTHEEAWVWLEENGVGSKATILWK